MKEKEVKYFKKDQKLKINIDEALAMYE